MPISVIVHIPNEEVMLGEIEEMPSPTDTLLVLNNPRRRGGKDVAYIDVAVTTVVWHWSRIHFVEIMPSEEEEQIVSFVRE